MPFVCIFVFGMLIGSLLSSYLYVRVCICAHALIDVLTFLFKFSVNNLLLIITAAQIYYTFRAHYFIICISD